MYCLYLEIKFCELGKSEFQLHSHKNEEVQVSFIQD